MQQKCRPEKFAFSTRQFELWVRLLTDRAQSARSLSLTCGDARFGCRKVERQFVRSARGDVEGFLQRDDLAIAFDLRHDAIIAPGCPGW